MNQSLRKQSTFRDLKLTDFPPPLAVVVCDFSGFLVVVGVVAAGVSFESECLYAQVVYLCFLHPPSCFSLGHMSRALSFFCCSCRINNSDLFRFGWFFRNLLGLFPLFRRFLGLCLWNGREHFARELE